MKELRMVSAKIHAAFHDRLCRHWKRRQNGDYNG